MNRSLAWLMAAAALGLAATGAWAQAGARARAAAAPASAAASAAVVAGEGGVDRAELEGTKIIGNRELPKVLYLVPWKKPLPGELAGRPPQSVLDEVLAPVDRDVFRRQVQYDAQINRRLPPDTSVTAKPATPGGAAAPAAPR